MIHLYICNKFSFTDYALLCPNVSQLFTDSLQLEETPLNILSKLTQDISNDTWET